MSASDVFLPPDQKVRCPNCGNGTRTDDAERFLASHRQFPSICNRTARISYCRDQMAYWQRELQWAEWATDVKLAT